MKTVLVFGDSLSAGYGLAREQSWVSLLAGRLQSAGLPYRVANASVSGETTGGGVRRIEEALAVHRPAVVVLELGANDGLRGQPLDAMRRNLETMARSAQRAGARVVLVGMRLPPNYGPGYTEKFHRTYVDLAKSLRLALVPFLFEGFAQDREFFQADGVHPAARAQPLMLDNVWTALRPLLSK